MGKRAHDLRNESFSTFAMQVEQFRSSPRTGNSKHAWSIDQSVQSGTISRRCRSPTLGRPTANEMALVTAK